MCVCVWGGGAKLFIIDVVRRRACVIVCLGCVCVCVAKLFIIDVVRWFAEGMT